MASWRSWGSVDPLDFRPVPETNNCVVWCIMLHERPVAADEAVPLFVDVDGTLTRADISLESFVRIARSGIGALITLILWLIAGRAVAKTMAARRDRIDAANLPYRQEVL